MNEYKVEEMMNLSEDEQLEWLDEAMSDPNGVLVFGEEE